MTESELLAGFEACTLPAASLSHREHVRLAWAYLRERPLLEALERVTRGIQRFAAAHGHAGKYHATVTWAWVLLVHERLEGGGRELPWEAFAATNPDLFARGAEGPIARAYRPETLQSPLARRVFVWPDRLSGVDVGGGG